MRLGVKFQNGNTGMGALGFYLKEMKGKALIQLHDADKIFSRFPQRFLQMWEIAQRELGLPGDYLYLLDADGMSNTVTITVPIGRGEPGGVEMDYDEYDTYIKRRGWPYAIIDVTTVVSFDMFDMNGAIDLQPKPEAETDPAPTDETE